DLRDRLLPLPAAAEAPVRLAERDRLPDGEHEPEAEPSLEPRRAVAVRHADLGTVNDVGARQRAREPEVAVAEREGREVARAAARQPAAHRADLVDPEVEPGQIELVGARREHLDVEPVGEELPRAQVPRVRGVAAQQNDPRPAHRCRSACTSSSGIARSSSASAAKTTSASASCTSHTNGSSSIANAGTAASAMRGVNPKTG